MHHSLDQLINAIVKLPGFGRKSAQRVAFYLLKEPRLADEITKALESARSSLRTCSQCFGLAEGELCDVCADPRRDHETLCVVEEPSDLLAFEQTALFRGVYHVLGGVLSPIDGVGPGELHIAELVSRTANEGVKEIIVATSATTEGEATAVYIARTLRNNGVKVTRIARGLPVGADIELADPETIVRSLEDRREI